VLVYVDESGDAGLKVAQGSSPYFVIASVAIADEEETLALNQRIILLRRELHLSPTHEFKFNKSSREVRLAFLRAVAPYDFFYYGIVINKAALYGEGFAVKESFYKYATQLLFLNARENLTDARVFIDASGERLFRRQFVAYLKKRVNAERRHIRSVAFLDSSTSGMIQLADMIAGALNRSYGGKADRGEYRAVLRHREARVQVWPSEKKEEPKP
jgi:hypothetical protein